MLGVEHEPRSDPAERRKSNENQLPPANSTDTFDEIAAGERITCGLRTDQTVICYGTGFDTNHKGPAGKFLQVKANTNFACGIRVDHSAICWTATSETVVP